MSKNLIVLSAPSGTGKTTICKELLKRNKDWKFSVSATTRPPREKEVDGRDYIFMSNQKFDHMAKFGDFLEWEWVHGNKYGTLAGQLEDVIDDNEVMLLDIDVKGGFSIMEEYPEDTFSIFIEPPGFDIPEKKLVLEERLLKRGNEQTTQIKNRLKRFEKEMEFIDRFNTSFVNDNLEEAIVAVEKAIKENI
ncbi:MAG: guanylate kinase [Candidatus Marinimicrobia bacterium]|nr:guanylate kinase [Candidatus Neomarinimicrobiota bacterium]